MMQSLHLFTPAEFCHGEFQGQQVNLLLAIMPDMIESCHARVGRCPEGGRDAFLLV